MIVTITVDTDKARQALIMTSISWEQADHYVQCSDEDVVRDVLGHMRGWGIKLKEDTNAD